MIFDPETEAGAHARDRFATDKVGWLTTVTPKGQPQSTPVWFLWVDDEILVYGDHRAFRNRNIEANPKVSFHLADDGFGGDIVAIQGEARIDPDHPAIPDNAAYLEKYGEWIDKGFGSSHRMAQTYSMPIRIRPTRAVAFQG